MTPNPPRVDPALIAALRADLLASRFTVAGVTELLGPLASAALDRHPWHAAPPVGRRPASGRPTTARTPRAGAWLRDAHGRWLSMQNNGPHLRR
jgi:hypothetical protein